MASSALMKVIRVASGKKTYPTGNPNFSVIQAYPAAIPATQSDPFLMCDHFGPTASSGLIQDPDEFSIPWHPHRGMDILTYLVAGTGRHADSLGNRGTFASPGMQWISVGSGIEHAEGGGTPAGESMEGFQIWVNVPGERKMDDPRYGTEPPENIPGISSTAFPGMKGRLVAGEMRQPDAGAGAGAAAGAGSVLRGPFKTVVDVQIVDYCFSSGGGSGAYVHEVPAGLNNTLAYVYRGAGTVNGQTVSMHQIVHLDANDVAARGVALTPTPASNAADFCVVLFSGRRIGEPIAWHGPFVMNTQAEIEQTVAEYQRRDGRFFRQRAPWDFKKLAAFPRDHPAVLEHEKQRQQQK